MQAFLHDTLIEYISTEDKRAKEFIIDVLIDRLNFQNISTEKAILNEAIKLIPNLNASTSALITFMMLRQQMVNPSISFMLELFFKQLSPIVDIAYNIKTIDIAVSYTHLLTNTVSTRAACNITADRHHKSPKAIILFFIYLLFIFSNGWQY